MTKERAHKADGGGGTRGCSYMREDKRATGFTVVVSSRFSEKTFCCSQDDFWVE